MRRYADPVRSAPRGISESPSRFRGWQSAPKSINILPPWLGRGRVFAVRPAVAQKFMKMQSLSIGMRVRHPQYGVGTVKSLSEHLADVRFDDALRSLDPEASDLTLAEPGAAITGLEVPLAQFVESTIEKVIERMGVERPEAVAPQLAARWHKGRIVLHPADPSLQTKEVPLETFFHKVVGVRNQLRVLEQKINAHPNLTDAEKIEMQQYITRCYGSLTTFNLLFKEKEDQF